MVARHSFRCQSLLLSLAVLHAADQPSLRVTDAKDVIARMSGRYLSSRGRILIHAEIETEEEAGSTVRQRRRQWRLLQVGDRTRLDLYPNIGKDPIIITQQNGRLLLYIATTREQIESPVGDANAAAVEQALFRVRTTLLNRLCDLAATEFEVDSIKDASVTVAGAKRECHKVVIHASNKDRASSWSAELWIDRTSSLLWRANLSMVQPPGRRVQEQVTWVETRVGSDVPAAELDWTPPSDSKPMKRIPAVLPM